MICEIVNDCIKLAVNSMGAELMSIKSVKDGLEYIWQGDPTYWARRSPTLFPIVGMLNGDKYMYDGKEYEMEIHGFAKTSEFELVQKSMDSLVFRLVESKQTLKKYPFKFELYTSYKLKDNAVLIGHRVVNKEKGYIWFSIGEHPGFNCPLFENETMEDYSLMLEKEEKINRKFLENGLLTDKEELFLGNEKEVKLSKSLFESRAVILQGLQSKSAAIVSRNHKRKVTITLEGYPYLGIWSPETGAPFVCIEPWYGVASGVNSSRNLTEKEGILSLNKGKEFNCGYRIILD